MTAFDYITFDGKQHRWKMIILAIKEEEWIQSGAEFLEQVTERKRLLKERDSEVFASLPGSEPACHEVMKLLAVHLPKYYPSHFHIQE